MTDGETAAIRSACATLVAAYCHAVDLYDHEAVMKLWSDDPVYESPTGALRGLDAIRGYFDAKPRVARGVHLLSTVHIDVESADRATGRAYMTFHVDAAPPDEGPSPVAPPVVISRLAHVFARTPSGWRIARQRVEIVFGRAFAART